MGKWALGHIWWVGSVPALRMGKLKVSLADLRWQCRRRPEPGMGRGGQSGSGGLLSMPHPPGRPDLHPEVPGAPASRASCPVLTEPFTDPQTLPPRRWDYHSCFYRWGNRSSEKYSAPRLAAQGNSNWGLLPPSRVPCPVKDKYMQPVSWRAKTLNYF